MELSDFLIPVNSTLFQNDNGYLSSDWGSRIDIHYKEPPKLEGKKIALIGLKTKAELELAAVPGLIRRYLYRMKDHDNGKTIADLGDFVLSDDPEKDCEKLGFLLSELQNMSVIPVIMAKHQLYALSQYLAFEYNKELVNIVSVDAAIDFSETLFDETSDDNIWQKICYRDESKVFNFSNIGYQSYYVSSKILEMMEKLYFDIYRLGMVREDIKEMEPVMRSAGLCAFDMRSIRQSDAPAVLKTGPNGFHGEEACALARYAGSADMLKSFGVYGLDTEANDQGQSAHLAAQMIWYFAEGLTFRNTEKPLQEAARFFKYITSPKGHSYNITFFKSKFSGRWWMEVPVGEGFGDNENSSVIPCSYKDYQKAVKGEIPERWWITMQKLS